MGSVRFNEVPEKVWEASVQRQVRFNRVPEKVPVKVWEILVQSQVRFKRVPERVREKVWEAIWCKARSGSTGFRRRFRKRFRKALVLNRVPEEGSGEGLEGFSAESTGFRRRFRRRSGRLRCRAGSVQQDLRPFDSRNPSWGVSSAWLGRRFRKIGKNKALRLLGIPPKLIFIFFYPNWGPSNPKRNRWPWPGECVPAGWCSGWGPCAVESSSLAYRYA